ncbi:MAG: ferritin family protein [Candidatus Omnitrophica bacterium]|nr:ferritin family protein [Candidatus Omnitrophota bacterium]
MDNISLKDMLKEALAMEEKGFGFYNDIVGKVENDITKKMFEFLAKNELLHIESIKSFYTSLAKNGDLPELNLDELMAGRKNDLSIFARNISELKDKIKKSDADKEACEFAIDFENSGYRYYKNMRKDAKDEKLVKLLDFLLEEEKAHCDSITKLHTYITDSANWYMYEEESFPQGG